MVGTMTDAATQTPEQWAKKIVGGHTLEEGYGSYLSCYICADPFPCAAVQGARHVLALTAALRKHGQHSYECRHMQSDDEGAPCDCGLDTALAGEGRE
jgi:hypothetical protein